MPEAAAARPAPPIRPEFEHAEIAAGDHGAVERRLSLPERVANNEAARKAFILVVLGLAWELYARWVANDLIFPTLLQTLAAFRDATVDGPLLDRIGTSLRVLAIGYSLGIAIAAAFTVLAVSTRLGTDLLSTLTAMFNPLPAIALLPLALLWFGLGIKSLVFVIIHSVLWAVALNTHTGFLAVPETLRMAGRNVGLGGLGWFIYEAKNQLEIPSVFAGLFTVILIGLLVENLIFRNIERVTIRRWGMQT